MERLVVEPPRNEWSVVAGTFRARRGRADVGDLLQAAATPRGAFRRPPEGRAHKRPSALLSALDVCPIRPRADAAHLDACGRADHSFLGGSTTSALASLALVSRRKPFVLRQSLPMHAHAGSPGNFHELRLPKVTPRQETRLPWWLERRGAHFW